MEQTVQKYCCSRRMLRINTCRIVATSASGVNMSCCALQQAIRGSIWAVAPCNKRFRGQSELLHHCNSRFGGQYELLHRCNSRFGGWQSHVFEKNSRSGVDNRMFLRKTIVRGLTIARFWEKQSFGGWQSHIFRKKQLFGQDELLHRYSGHSADKERRPTNFCLLTACIHITIYPKLSYIMASCSTPKLSR